jgi:hypothetical protein
VVTGTVRITATHTPELHLRPEEQTSQASFLQDWPLPTYLLHLFIPDASDKQEVPDTQFESELQGEPQEARVVVLRVTVVALVVAAVVALVVASVVAAVVALVVASVVAAVVALVVASVVAAVVVGGGVALVTETQ